MLKGLNQGLLEGNTYSKMPPPDIKRSKIAYLFDAQSAQKPKGNHPVQVASGKNLGWFLNLH